MFTSIRVDFQAILEKDPAVRSKLEAVICYPGFHALVIHRISHWLWSRGLDRKRPSLMLTARILAHLGRFMTGVEIHPGAVIGKGVFIDHGMGIVIGETALIEDDVTLFHGVTLGGTGKHKGKRHPTVRAGAVIGARATLLGPITIGVRAKIGANAVVLKDIPAYATAIGTPPAQRIIEYPPDAHSTPSGTQEPLRVPAAT